MRVDTEQRVMLAHGIAFVLNLWGLVKADLVNLDLGQWTESAGTHLGNLKATLKTDEAQWKNCLNAITAKTWPKESTLKNVLDLAARKKTTICGCRTRCVC